MARKRKEIGATFYPRDVLFILEDDVTIEEKACFCDAIANLIAGNYDYYISDRLIRKEFLSITQRVIEARQHLQDINDRNQQIAEERENAKKKQSNTSVHQSDTSVHQSDTNVSNTIKNNTIKNNTIKNNNNPPLSPPNEQGNGMREEFLSFMDFWSLYVKWRNHDNGKRLAWHDTDKKVENTVMMISKTNPNEASYKEKEWLETNKEHMAVLPDFDRWRKMWNLAESLNNPPLLTLSVFDTAYKAGGSTAECVEILTEKANDLKRGFQPNDMLKWLLSFVKKQ